MNILDLIALCRPHRNRRGFAVSGGAAVVQSSEGEGEETSVLNPQIL